MMENANTYTRSLSDAAILKQMGQALKQMRLKKNFTQAQLAEAADLNRWTVAQIEKGESTSMITFIKILRVLDALYLLNDFQVRDEISPIAYVKMQKKQRKRASGNTLNEPEEDLGW